MPAVSLEDGQTQQQDEELLPESALHDARLCPLLSEDGLRRAPNPRPFLWDQLPRKDQLTQRGPPHRHDHGPPHLIQPIARLWRGWWWTRWRGERRSNIMTSSCFRRPSTARSLNKDPGLESYLDASTVVFLTCLCWAGDTWKKLKLIK